MAFKVIDDDTIQTILNNYVKHRNYKAFNSQSNNNNNDNQMFECENSNSRDDNVLSARDWFLDGALSAFQSIRNAATLRLKEEDFVNEVEVAFRKFVEFINSIRLAEENISSSSLDVNKKHGEELWMICFPLFVHIFIQLFECGHISNANNFFLEHFQRFTKKTNHLQFLNSMQSSLANCKLNQALQNFKNFKCRILISEDSFKLLSQFLEHGQHLSILQTFNSCLDFRVMTQEESNYQQTYQEPSIRQADDMDLLEESLSNPHNSPEMNEILEVIKTVRDLNDEPDLNYPTQAYQTTICLCKIQSEKICSVAISKNLSKIVAGTENSEIILWDCDLTDDLQYYSSRIFRHWKRVPVKQISSVLDFKFINPKEFSEEDSFDNNVNFDVKDKVDPIIFRGHSDAIYELSFIFDSNLLLSCSSDTTIRAWDVNSGSCLALYKGHPHAIWTIDSNDSGCFISGGRDGVAMMWDIERTVPMRIYSGHMMDINQIKFHPNCNYLATASADKSIILWDVNQVRQVRMFCGHQTAVNAVRFSSCGKYLTSASEDGSVRIWDISQSQCISEMKDHQDNIRSITLGPKDNLLASCGVASSAVHIWENPIICARSEHPTPFIAIDVNSGIENDIEINYNNLIDVQFIRHNVLLAFSNNRNSLQKM